MQQLLGQLGIDWRLLVSQAVNFFILLFILWYFVYKPLLKLLRDRRARIEEGLSKADEADRRLVEIEEIGKEKVKSAEAQALAILKKTESESRELEARLLSGIKKKEADELKAQAELLKSEEEASRCKVEREAVALVREAIVRTVGKAGSQIDEALINSAVEAASKSRP